MEKAARILIADNDYSYRKTVGEYLDLHGYKVLHAENPSEAERILQEGAIDLAVLDLRLSNNDDDKDLSGITIAQELAPHVPKIMLTSFPSFQAVRVAFAPQSERPPAAVAFLTKAEGLNALLSAVELALRQAEGHKHQEENERGWVLPDPPDDLIASCAAGELVLYAGSGLSAQSGLLTWRPFVSDLLEWANRAGFISTDFAESLREAIAHGDTDFVADSIVSAVGGNSGPLHAYLEQTFLKSPYLDTGDSLSPSHYLLRAIPFSAALTTNFDDLLERTFGLPGISIYTPYDTERLRSALLNQRFFLLKLYGTLTRPDTLQVAPAQYSASISENLLFSQFMESLFFSRTLLFIGASLDGIEAYLTGLKFRGANPFRQHYALVNVTGNAWQAKAEVIQRRFSIQVLPYTASEHFPEVGEFLKRFSDSLKALPSLVNDASSSPYEKLSRVKLLRVQLENIGPFRSQSFDFSGQWNVLLGDNGVGKSTVLKAIAVGISGDAAKGYAEHLIKGGRPSGTITLEIESEVNKQRATKTYVTKILRSDTGVEIQSLPTRALHAEDWVVIGFPPLRYMSWSREVESPSVRDVPVPADLLPLITSEPDPRPNQIKNWLFKLDHQIQREINEGLTETTNTRMRDAFYRIIAELTPGLKIQPGKINLEEQEVTVVTDDGEVPLESISQGTISLIGWVGVVLRRLFEIYGEEAAPLNQSALVLIDEIDAHMHPEWQRLLAPQVRKLFPNLQVISTTHSPLIVPSLLPNEIIRLQRDSETRDVRILVTDYNVQDYRTDQILTSPLFGLESSLAPVLQEQVSRYTELTAREELTPEEQLELERLAYEIGIKLPSPAERAEARIAYNLIQYALNKHLEEMEPESTSRITEEIKVQLQELITGSRRP